METFAALLARWTPLKEGQGKRLTYKGLDAGYMVVMDFPLISPCVYKPGQIISAFLAIYPLKYSHILPNTF